MTAEGLDEGNTPPPQRRGARPVGLGRRQLEQVDGSSQDRLAPQQVSREVGDLGNPELQAEARRPISRPTVLAITGLAGGAGRTTVSVALGQTFAAVRQHPVVAVEATRLPLGMLGSRVRLTTTATAHDFVAAAPPEDSDAAAAYLNAGPSGLLTLVGDRPATGRLLGAAAVAAAVQRLSAWYPLVLVDLPPSPTDPAVWPWVRERAAAVVLVSRATGPDLTMVAETVPVLARMGTAGPGGRVVVVVNQAVPGRMSRDAQIAEQLVAARVRSVVRLPYDDKLAGSREIRLGELGRRTRSALLQIAAACGAQFQ